MTANPKTDTKTMRELLAKYGRHDPLEPEDLRVVWYAAPGMLDEIDTLRKKNEEIRQIISENASAASDRIQAALRLNAERDALKAEVESWKAKAQKWEQDWGAARSKVFKLDAKVMALEAEIEKLKKGS